jgi:hypothetical protein
MVLVAWVGVFATQDLREGKYLTGTRSRANNSTFSRFAVKTIVVFAAWGEFMALP